MDRCHERFWRRFEEEGDKLKSSEYHGLVLIRAFDLSEMVLEQQIHHQSKERQLQLVTSTECKLNEMNEHCSRMFLKSAIILCCFANRGPGQAISLMLLINQLQGVEHMINNLVHKQRDFKNRLQRI